MASRDEWSSYRAIAVACRRGASVDAIFEGTFVSNLWRGIAARLFFHRLSMTPAEQLFLLAFYRAREREWLELLERWNVGTAARYVRRPALQNEARDRGRSPICRLSKQTNMNMNN